MGHAIGLMSKTELKQKRNVSQSFSVTVAGKLEPIPAEFGRKAGYTLNRVPIHYRATIHTPVHTFGQFVQASQPNLHIFGLWEETSVPG